MEKRPIVAALAGNPNVGKSSIFNGLTGLRQHTGNWPGKTVASAQGVFQYGGRDFLLVDLPGTYSLCPHSEEEEVTRNFLASGQADVIVAVCDATCLERGLYLLSQITRLDCVRDHGLPLVLCINLCDEAEKKGISIDFSLLQDVLQIPVVPCCARRSCTFHEIRQAIFDASSQKFSYDCLDFSPKLLAAETVSYSRTDYRARDELIDRIVTGPVSGKIIMAGLLMLIFWLTMAGANYPSQLLWDALFQAESWLAEGLTALSAPEWVISSLVYGLYRVLAWVVSVMLPPMAIFFPLFTLLEDLGYLPRVAFHMDKAFERCRSCGKQCLTMAMGLGCNAAGVTGCRIIDSPRERLIAILTNSMVPCNGRFPTLFTLITLFFTAGIQRSSAGSLAAAACLTLIILLGVFATLGASWFLSHTLLKGVPSSFTLELPPYRRPQIGRVILRSIFDRTLFVLGRAAAVAAPAGLLIWGLANIAYVGPENGFFALARTGINSELASNAPTLLALLTGLFDPLGRLMGLDGVILTGFILGFPANEIVLPIILMAYLQSGVLTDMSDSVVLRELLAANGWTWQTAVSMVLFCLFHWPCSTTLLTIKKETGSWKWTAVSAALPTLLGIGACITITAVFRIF